MFPHNPDPVCPPARSLRAAIRDAADLAIAFLTLEGYGLDDLRLSSVPGAHGNFAAAIDDAATPPESVPIDRAAGAPWPPLGRRDMLAEQQPLGRKHPHRHELRAPKRPGRPGAGATREQLCLTPQRGSSPHRLAVTGTCDGSAGRPA